MLDKVSHFWIVCLACALFAVTCCDGTRVAPICSRALPPGVLSAGRFHTCAVLLNGSVSCWGKGSDTGVSGVLPLASFVYFSACIATSAMCDMMEFFHDFVYVTHYAFCRGGELAR